MGAVGPPTRALPARSVPTGATAPVAPVRSYDEQGYGAVYDDSYADGDVRGTTYGDAAYGDAGYGDDEFDDTYDEGDGEEDGRRGWRRLGLVVGIVVGSLLAVILLLAFWVNRQINPGGSPGEEVVVELESGQSTAEIAQVLRDHRVISDARVFTFYARFRSKGDIQAGVYELRTNMAMGDVLTVLAEGPLWNDSQATIQEGLIVEEVIQLLAENVESFDDDRLRAALDDLELRHLPDDVSVPDDLVWPPAQVRAEGMLYPETYALSDDMTELEFLQSMVDAFDTVYEDLGVDARAGEVDVGGDVTLSGYDVLVVASMIEKEAQVGEDRAKIARVIYNRLAADAPLGIDATGCYLKEESPCVLTVDDLTSDSPYNTREQRGLPPAPIASPGRSSIEAALEPADGSWFFYVLDVEAGDGSHLFTDDRDVFNEAKERCEEAGICG